MANKDILVGLTIKPAEEPEEITKSFDGEDENVDYSELTEAFTDLKKDMKKHYNKFSKELEVIEWQTKEFE